jgi:hypothetical protein
MSDIDPQEYGEMRAELRSLRREVDEVRADMKTLLEIANRSKGAMFFGGSVVATLGGAITLIAERFILR